MIRINENYLNLQRSYLFVEIAEKVRKYQADHPDRQIIKLGIGDVTLPLPKTVVAALHQAADEMAKAESFRGYGPEQGYEFLRNSIAERDYRSRGVAVSPDEVFVSDGAKCDTGNMQELFSETAVVALPDPVYPVYIDSNVMAGRSGGFEGGRYRNIRYLSATDGNGFVPDPPEEPVDLLYLCFPNNPTGAVATKEQLARYVDYAQRVGALILFDAAYAEFIQDESLPRSIFEIPGADTCAVEFRSFSKTAGFTGLRLAYTVVPKAVRIADSSGSEHSLHRLWLRRQTTKFNGASYPIQVAGAAAYSKAGDSEIRSSIAYYLENAAIIRNTMTDLGYSCTGGINSPYIWIQTGESSWDFFDRLLHNAAVVTTPGVGFGPGGEGYIRISAFNDRAAVEEAVGRIRDAL